MQITAGVHIKEQHAIQNGMTFTKSFRPKARLASQIYIKHKKETKISNERRVRTRMYEWDEFYSYWRWQKGFIDSSKLWHYLKFKYIFRIPLKVELPRIWRVIKDEFGLNFLTYFQSHRFFSSIKYYEL